MQNPFGCCTWNNDQRMKWAQGSAGHPNINVFIFLAHLHRACERNRARYPPLRCANIGNERSVHAPGTAQSSARFSWRRGWGSAGLETRLGTSWWSSSPWWKRWSGILWRWCPSGSRGGHLQAVEMMIQQIIWNISNNKKVRSELFLYMLLNPIFSWCDIFTICLWIGLLQRIFLRLHI